METIQFDQGFAYGMGVFETIAVHCGKTVFCEPHLDRLEQGMERLNIRNRAYERSAVLEELNRRAVGRDRIVLKLIVTEKNLIFRERNNPYSEETRRKGLKLCFAEARRNETSPFTYHKSLQRGDFVLEKENALRRGFDEPLFLNHAGRVTETAAANLFCVKDGVVRTPPLSDGLLNGVMRQFLLGIFPEIREESLRPEAVKNADELFLTNSLMGIMPVTSLEDIRFEQRTRGEELSAMYLAYLRKLKD